MPTTRQATDVLDREFLEIRARILAVAADLDRLDRASGHPGLSPDRRVAQIRRALEALLVPEPGRAETVQHIFSLDYDPDWQSAFGMSGRR
jgi:hypothetical protein